MNELVLSEQEEFKFNFLNETRDLLDDARRIFESIERNPNLKELDLILTLTKYIKSTSAVVNCQKILSISNEVERFILEIQNDNSLLSLEAITIIERMYQDLAVIIDKSLNGKFNNFIDEFKSIIEKNDLVESN